MQASRVLVKHRLLAPTFPGSQRPRRSLHPRLYIRNETRCYRQTTPWMARWGKRHIQNPEPPRSPHVQAILTQPANLPDAEDLDEWDSITALEKSRNDLDWRLQLTDPERWEIESDLDGNSCDAATRLVHIHASDLELWEELFLYRLRRHGLDGAKMIWRHLDTAASKTPMRIWERPRLWKALLELALKDHEVLDKLISHCAKMAAIFSDKPDLFYSDVMKQVLHEHDSRAFYWHTALQPLQPTKFELRKLFDDICSDSLALDYFRSFCFELRAFSDMYSHIVARLLLDDRLDEALEWHDRLLKHGDLPASFEPLHKALGRLIKNGHMMLGHRIATELHNAGVQGGRRWLRASAPDTHSPQELTPGQSTPTAETFFSRLPNRHFSDRFIARLIATSFFPVETILTGLTAVNVTGIGPLAYRQLLFRIATPDSDDPGSQVDQSHVARATTLLQQAAVDLELSTFSSLVQQLAASKEKSILQSVLRSDQHPDILDDIDLQESLLARYVERGSKGDIDRTLAILRFVKGEAFGDARRGDISNLRLLHAIGRKDKTAALSVVHEIVKDHKTLEVTALSVLLYEVMFTPRAKDCRPETYDELDQVTDFMMNMQKSGYVVPLRAWIELIKRRTWQGNVSACQRILDWKFKWVTDGRFRLAQTVSSARSFKWASYYDRWHENMDHPVPYLEALFSKRMYIYLMNVGFAADARKHQNVLASNQLQPLSGTHSQKVDLLANSTSLWGLRFLASLRQKGLPCSTDHVRKICTARLTILFGPRIPREHEHRQVQMARKANWTDYAAAMERIWGEKLFGGEMQRRGRTLRFTLYDDPDRLTKEARRLLTRSCLRLRLQAAERDKRSASDTTLPQSASGNRALQRGILVHGRERLRAWHAALPDADTDELLQTLIPELSATGVLKDDRLLTLSPRQREKLLVNKFRKDSENPSEGFSKIAQDNKHFQPFALRLTSYRIPRRISRGPVSGTQALELPYRYSNGNNSDAQTGDRLGSKGRKRRR